ISEKHNVHPREWIEEPKTNPRPRESSESRARREALDQPDHANEVREREQELVRERVNPGRGGQHIKQRPIGVEATIPRIAFANHRPLDEVVRVISRSPNPAKSSQSEKRR